MRFTVLAAICLLNFHYLSNAYASIETFEFVIDNDGDLGFSPPFGTLRVSDDVVDQLEFTISIDTSKFGPNADIQSFGFQVDFAGVLDFNPSPTTILGKTLTFSNKVAGTGNTSFDVVVNFGNGSPIINPVTFVLEGTGLDLDDLFNASTTETNTSLDVHFMVHVQSTDTAAGSEAIGGLYVPVVPTGGGPDPHMPEPNSVLVWSLLGLVASSSASRRLR